MKLNLRRPLHPWYTSAAGLTVIGLLLLAGHRVHAGATEKASWFDPSGIGGALVICGGGPIPEEARAEFIKLAGGSQAHIVVIPTANAKADGPEAASLLEPWRSGAVASVQLLHTRSRQRADEADFVAPLQQATGVWFVGGQQRRIAAAYGGTAVEQALYQLLERGGVIGGTSAGAAIQSRVMIVGGNPHAELGKGFDLLPGAVIDQHFLVRHRQPRLLGVLAKHPQLVGFGIDERAAMIVRGRQVRIVGSSTVTVCFGATADRPARQLVLEPGDRADLTALRRAARARLLPPFPPPRPDLPQVPKGTLLIVGGRMTESIARTFVRLAGGADARIVVLPTAGADPRPAEPRDVSLFRRAGARRVTILPQRQREEVESPRFLAALRQADAVWFSGGRQWRLVDAYENTRAYSELHAVLKRGGVIGGSSAGASIQAEYLVRGDPLGNRRMMAPGYERGFRFLPGTAIDQHFSQRNRFADMEQLIAKHPQLLGIGIDEQTALVVRGRLASVIGEHSVFFYDGREAAGEHPPRSVAVPAGSCYDLVARNVVEPAKAPVLSGQLRKATDGNDR